ncbi:MAG: histidine kinase [Planctomycetota bacterium]
MGPALAADLPPRITLRGVLILALAQAGLALAYTACLVAEVGASRAAFGPHLGRSLLGGATHLLALAPVWWVIIRQLDGRRWPVRLGAHAVALPLFLAGWHELYRGAVHVVGALPLYEASVPWHYYFGAVTYTAEFAILHVVREQHLLRRREELAAELRDLAHRAELKGLRAQVMPHFLFNTLHTLSAAVPRDHEELRRRIAQLGALLRYTLNAADRDRVTLREELQFARDYLDLEQARLGDRLTVAFDIDERALQAPVPPVVLQPLVENALKHGVASHRHGGEVSLSIARHDGCAVVRVCDRAKGGTRRPVPDGPGFGLRSVAARLQRLGHGARLRTEPTPTGYAAELVVPMEPACAP